MTNKQINKLSQACYSNGSLNVNVVEMVSKKLSRRDLKRYIAALKRCEKKRTVTVSLPFLPETSEQKKIASSFPHKHVRFVSNPSLILGANIAKGDDLLEFSLTKSLDDIAALVATTYDQ